MRERVISFVRRYRPEPEEYVKGKSFRWFVRVNNWFCRQQILNARDAMVRPDGLIQRRSGSSAVKPRRTGDD
jgi:hypothetical protein